MKIDENNKTLSFLISLDFYDGKNTVTLKQVKEVLVPYAIKKK